MRNMLAVVVVCLALVRFGFSETGHSIYYCRDHGPQHNLDVEQLMGMWFGIEIIRQKRDNVHEIVYDEGCPVFHFSEDTSPATTTTTQYTQDYIYPNNYRSKFERKYDEDSYAYTTQRSSYTDGFNIYNSNDNGYRYNDDNLHYNRMNHRDELKKLRVLAIDKGVETEYSVRYNVSKAGFWISSGPQNGSSLNEKFKSFAGVIQVLKAVGNHMVLVFCHQLPQQEVFTVLLSRVQNLSQHDIHGVHSLMNRKGLKTTSIVKVCTANGAAGTYASAAVFGLTTYLIAGHFW